jgi:hypothetical protein
VLSLLRVTTEWGHDAYIEATCKGPIEDHVNTDHLSSAIGATHGESAPDALSVALARDWGLLLFRVGMLPIYAAFHPSVREPRRHLHHGRERRVCGVCTWHVVT